MNYLKRMHRVCVENNIGFIEGLSTLERKVGQYIERDENNNKQG